MDFIGTISHSSACKKRRAPLDSQPIATGSVWLRAGNMRLASERKSWLRGRVNNSTRVGRVAGTTGMRKTSLT